MRMTEQDYRLLLKATLLLSDVSDGTLTLRCPEGMDKVYELDRYELSLSESHRLRGIKSELHGRLEMLNELSTL